MNPCEIVTIVSALSCAIAKNRSIEELNILSAIFTQIGDSLTTIAVTRSPLNNTNTTNSSNNTNC